MFNPPTIIDSQGNLIDLVMESSEDATETIQYEEMVKHFDIKF